MTAIDAPATHRPPVISPAPRRRTIGLVSLGVLTVLTGLSTWFGWNSLTGRWPRYPNARTISGPAPGCHTAGFGSDVYRGSWKLTFGHCVDTADSPAQAEGWYEQLGWIDSGARQRRQDTLTDVITAGTFRLRIARWVEALPAGEATRLRIRVPYHVNSPLLPVDPNAPPFWWGLGR
jgi:hypothetical protein